VSQLNGWHGTRIVRCQLIFAPDFGKKPDEVKLLQQFQLHEVDMKPDLKCFVDLDTPTMQRLVKVAVQDQNRDAAEVIVLGPYNGKLFLDGGLAETYGEIYLYPVLLKYKDLKGLRIPKEKETEIAHTICMTRYNPETEDAFNFAKLVARLKQQKMDSLVKATNHDCARIKSDGPY